MYSVLRLFLHYVLFLVVGFLTSLCVLSINLLLDTWFAASIFSHSVGCYLIVFFAVQKLLNLMSCAFSAFIAFVSEMLAKKLVRIWRKRHTDIVGV